MNNETDQHPAPAEPENPKQEPQTVWELLPLIWDVRMLWVFLLGFCSGYPWAVWSSCQVVWLKDLDVAKSTIGLFSLLGTGYAINWLWAPVVDHVRIPVLNRIGHWKSWLLLCLLIMCITTYGVSFFVVFEPEADPVPILTMFAFFLLVIAWTSATLDIATAAYRINIIKPNESRLIGLAASMEVAGWWVGFGVPAGFALFWVDQLGWNVTYAGLAALFLLLALIVTFGIGEPARAARPPISRFMDLLDRTHFGALREFFKRNGLTLATFILLFVFSFKLGEAFLGRMSLVFYKDIGFTSQQIGILSKWVGTAITVGGSIVAGLFIVRFKILPTLIVAGIGMAATNLMFAWIAMNATAHGMPSETLYLWTTILDGISGAIATMAFVSFITHYTSRVHSATQYAALSSLGTFGRTSLAAFSGFLVEGLGDNWSLFFVLTALMVIPALMFLWPLHRSMKKQTANSE